jgi:hypothetical protein
MAKAERSWLTPIKTVTVPGSLAQVKACFDRIAYFWTPTRGDWITWREAVHQWGRPENPCRVTYKVSALDEYDGQRTSAAIEVYEEPTGTRVVFVDGYNPDNAGPAAVWPPIGHDFTAFAAMVCKELSPLPARIARALELKGRGLTPKQIAEELTGDGQKTSERTVRRYLEKGRG